MNHRLSPTTAITISCIRTTDPDTAKRVPHLAGIGLCHVANSETGPYDITVAVSAVPHGSNANDARLIRWLTDQLSDPAILVGWRLADAIVPSMLAAATNASPQADRAFVDALARAVGTGAIDLADGFRGAAAPAFHAICAGGSIAMTQPDAEMLATVGSEREQAIAAMLAANAVATVRLWSNTMPDFADALHDVAIDTLHAWQAAAAITAIK